MVGSAALAVVRSRWFPWALVVLVCVVAWRHPRIVTTSTTVHEKGETKWRTTTTERLKIMGAPGSTTIVQPDGTIIIYGPTSVDVTRSTTGEGASTVERNTTTTTKTETVRSDWGVSAGVLVPSPYVNAAPVPWIAVDRRILGPFAAVVTARMNPGHGPDVGVGVRFEF